MLGLLSVTTHLAPGVLVHRRQQPVRCNRGRGGVEDSVVYIRMLPVIFTVSSFTFMNVESLGRQ